MKKSVAHELVNKAGFMARLFSKKNREFNYNNETFKIVRIVPLSSHRAVIILEKNTAKRAVMEACYLNNGKWQMKFPKYAHLIGNNILYSLLQEVEEFNFKKNFKEDVINLINRDEFKSEFLQWENGVPNRIRLLTDETKEIITSDKTGKKFPKYVFSVERVPGKGEKKKISLMKNDVINMIRQMDKAAGKKVNTLVGSVWDYTVTIQEDKSWDTELQLVNVNSTGQSVQSEKIQNTNTKKQ